MINNETHASRHLEWDFCLNVRDLGGLATVPGEVLPLDRFVRADSLSRLTPAGQQALLAYGIRTVIDLRKPQEASAEPHAFMQHPSVNYLNMPLERFTPHVSAKIVKAQSRGEVYCIILDHYPDLIAAVLRAFIHADPGGILFHCHSGKDRTGTIAALTQRLVGVPDELVVEDYALSQERLLEDRDSTPDVANDKAPVHFWDQPTALPEMMTMMLNHLDDVYGGTAGYLTAAGLMKTELDAIRQRLLLP